MNASDSVIVGPTNVSASSHDSGVARRLKVLISGVFHCDDLRSERRKEPRLLNQINSDSIDSVALSFAKYFSSRFFFLSIFHNFIFIFLDFSISRFLFVSGMLTQS
jgi:hypothetical protein